MTDPYAGWQSHFSLIVLHADQSLALLVREHGGWSLPSVHTARFIWWRSFGRFEDTVRAELSDTLRGLRCLDRHDDERSRESHRVYLVEIDGAQADLSWGTWFDREQAAELVFNRGEHRDLLLRALQDHPFRSEPDWTPWFRPGWFAAASTWLQDQLQALGYSWQSIQRDYTWPLSSILVAETPAGDFYMKAATPVRSLVNEPIVTAYLASEFPDVVPAPLATDAKQRWMLLPDLGYPIRDASDGDVTRTLDLFADLQLRTIDHVDKLVEIGCPDRRLDKLATQVDLLLEIDEDLSGLERHELDQLHHCAPRLREMCFRLVEYRVPPTLLHGDFHLGNVACVQGQLLFFDWGQACVSHPFVDVALFFDAERTIDGFPERYLKKWTQFEPIERLRQAWVAAVPVSKLLHAIEYCQIGAHLGPGQDEVTSDVTYSLRALLRSAAQ